MRPFERVDDLLGAMLDGAPLVAVLAVAQRCDSTPGPRCEGHPARVQHRGLDPLGYMRWYGAVEISREDYAQHEAEMEISAAGPTDSNRHTGGGAARPRIHPVAEGGLRPCA